MLTKLQISNYALIQSLNIDFTQGFSVITGETGAGKSIILGALGLLMGKRADASAIKTGEKKCCVEATFDVSALGLDALMEAHDIDFDGRECIIRREVTAAGKSRAFINDSPVQLAVLKAVSNAVIDIHSQHHNLLMGREDFLLDVLDATAANAELLKAYAETFGRWQKATHELAELRRAQAEAEKNHDFLAFQYSQLEEADLKRGEQEKLEAESELLSHAEDIKTALFAAQQAIGDEGGDVANHLRRAASELENIVRVFTPAEQLAERLSSCRIEIDDIIGELDDSTERVEFDPARQQEVDARLDIIYELEKKHHVDTIDELIGIFDTLGEQLSNIENSDEAIADKEQEIKALSNELAQRGKALTAARQAAAERIAADLRETLRQLGMPNVRLRFDITERTAPAANGFDVVSFLFSANKNVPEQDVSQIASGGEVARLMLALKASIARSKNLPTIIFDEIDTGVSGTMAEKMGRVMQQMSASTQVICITHLPQIAALGQRHYYVHKHDTDTGTLSQISLLSDEERISEVANMLSGEQVTDAAISNARSLLGLD